MVYEFKQIDYKQGPVLAPMICEEKYYDVMSKFIKDGVEFTSYQVYTKP